MLLTVLLPWNFGGAKFCASFEYLPAEQTRGEVLIAWDQDFIRSCSVLKNTYCLSPEVTVIETNNSFILTTVYGPANNHEKQAFLAELTSCQPVNRPWLCIGDFNLICEAQDKNNNNINRAHMRRFR